MTCGDLNSLATQSKSMSLTLKIKWQYGVFPEEGKWGHKWNNVGKYETLPQIAARWLAERQHWACQHLEG